MYRKLRPLPTQTACLNCSRLRSIHAAPLSRVPVFIACRLPESLLEPNLSISLHNTTGEETAIDTAAGSIGRVLPLHALSDKLQGASMCQIRERFHILEYPGPPIASCCIRIWGRNSASAGRLLGLTGRGSAWTHSMGAQHGQGKACCCVLRKSRLGVQLFAGVPLHAQGVRRSLFGRERRCEEGQPPMREVRSRRRALEPADCSGPHRRELLSAEPLCAANGRAESGEGWYSKHQPQRVAACRPPSMESALVHDKVVPPPASLLFVAADPA